MGEMQLEGGMVREAELAFRKALETAEAQKALSLALRSALSYHALLERTERQAEGLALVRRYYERFTDSFSQRDLVRARELLNGAAH
jgi:sulfur relay (sulfurtransferase) DsrC/TusE family protein